MFAANPDYWTAVTGLAGAFIIAGAIDFVRSADTATGWRQWAVIGVVFWPFAFAVTALQQLGNESDAPSSDQTYFGAAVFVVVELVLLMGARSDPTND